MMLRIWLISLLSLSGAAYAASSVSSAPLNPPAPRISGNVSIARSNSLYAVNGVSQIASWDFAGSVAYKLPYHLSASASVDASQDIKAPETSDWGRFTTGLSMKPANPKSVILLTPSVKLGLPLSRAANSASQKASVSLSANAAVNPDNLVSKRMSLSFGLSGTRNIHDYDTAVSGRPNTQYSSSQSVSVGWSFTETLALGLAYTHFNTWNYQGAMKEYFSHSQELSYEVTKAWAVALGHSYGNPYTSVWKPDYQTYNTNLTDEDNSVVYGQVVYTF